MTAARETQEASAGSTLGEEETETPIVALKEPAAPAEIRAFRPEDDAARDAFVNAHPRASLFHLSGWRKAVTQAFGHEGRDLLAWRDGKLVGLLPLVRCRGLLGGSNLISMPYGVYGGPIAETHADELQLVEAAKRLAEEKSVGRLELRCLEENDFGLVPSDLYVTYIRELPEDPADVMKGMPKRARAEVRKARDKHGLVLQEGIWFLDDLIRLFHKSKRLLGSPGLPAKWYHALQQHLPGNIVMHLARKESDPLACLMSFVFRDTIMVYYIGVEPGANQQYSATNFACEGIQEWSIAKGLKVYDLGRSRQDSGAAKFKKNQGLEPRPLHYGYHLVKAKDVPKFNPSNPKTEILQKTWRKLPLWLTTRLSSPASRYLP